MRDIFQLPSSSSSTANRWTPKNNDVLRQQSCLLNHEFFINNSKSSDIYRRSKSCNTAGGKFIEQTKAEEEEGHVSVLAVFVTVLRKYSLAGCNSKSRQGFGVKEQLMEIGLPSDVRHVAHVTFDRFNGFLGLPVEFEPQVPRRPPSASTRVFGVSTESMQLSFDSRGNCVPTILLMMQRRLYEQDGLKNEGIFRINPENGQEEHAREQLNNGLIPENIDVHSLAGLIKAWFRELPKGILDSLHPEQVMEGQSEDECARLVKLLPPTEAALLDWAINLMADVARFENFNKMNARNVAMVFAPNMTKMSDPLTALMFVVQVMNFLKTLIEKELKARDDRSDEAGRMLDAEPSNEDGQQNDVTPLTLVVVANGNIDHEEEINISKEPPPGQISNSTDESRRDYQTHGFPNSVEDINADNNSAGDPNLVAIGKTRSRRRKGKKGHLSNSSIDAKKKGSSAVGERDVNTEMKKKESNIVRYSHVQRMEAWR